MELVPEKPDLRKKLQMVSHRPGVYLMRDRLRRVIYVGKARDLRKRLGHYFMPSKRRVADVKTRALIESIWDFEVHEVRNEAEALLLEGRLIKQFRPRYNVSFRDDKRFLLLKVNLEDPFPRFSLTRLRREDGAEYFGPFAHSGALRATLQWMTKYFGLRTCRPKIPGEKEYRHCQADIIVNCSAPCVGKVDAEGYRQRVQAACQFLEGRSPEVIDRVEEEMQSAAQKFQYEKAASLRDVADNLRKTVQTTTRVRKFTRSPNLPSERDPLEEVEQLGEVLRLEVAPLVMECFDISNISTTHCVASMVRFKNGLPDRKAYRRYRIRTVDGQDDFASMAEVVRRRYARLLAQGRDLPIDEDNQLSPREVMERFARELEATPRGARLPDLVVVDGGKGQLGVAAVELQKLGLGDLPIIGLAKEREEIYMPGKSHPLVLPHDWGALQLLQRIRDEAHRFANSYHQLLMKRRMVESQLDDCPGMSPGRKKLLLRKFGSVARLRKASPEEMAEISGISRAFAQRVQNFLQKGREGS